MSDIVFLSKLTSPQYGALVTTGKLIVLLPVGSVEPHGPHMSLCTDTVISVGAAECAAVKLQGMGWSPVIAPSIPYGVTECAAAFPGAISIAGNVLRQMVGAVVDGYLHSGAAHVCIVNNHLEPAQDAALRGVLADPVVTGRQKVSLACPLTRKWARTLTPEFKSGACHAGQYETSIVLACDPTLVDSALCDGLPEVPISLATKLREGTSDFLQMGLESAYAGSPASANAEEGRQTLEHLADMIVGEIFANKGSVS